MANLKIYYTYKTINLINNKVYYGKHIQPFGKIDSYLGSGKVLKKAIYKYGVENFKKIPLNFFSDVVSLAEGEKLLITEDMITDQNCYNLKGGGIGGIPYGKHHPMYGKKHKLESIIKMSKAKIGVKHTPERNLHKSNITKGRTHTEEAKKKMSDVKKSRMNSVTKQMISVGLKGNKNGIGNKGSSITIICINNNQTYKSIKDASINLKVPEAKISKQLKGIIENANGYKFKRQS